MDDITHIEIDFRVVNHGSVVIIEPVTEAAQEWVDISIDPTAQWWGRGFVAEPRYVANIIAGVEEAGLNWEIQL